MKLQYLGDARDAFKWDLLHWLCTTSSFSKLVYVPLLTEDDESNDGQTHHRRFPCQDFLRSFLDELKFRRLPPSLKQIASLGTVHPVNKFEVSVFAPERIVGSGEMRGDYWIDFKPSTLGNTVVFVDPDNGFETITQYQRGKPPGPKWIGHEELKSIFAFLPETSVVVVYQHRPMRTWDALFSDLGKNLVYVHSAVAAHESSLAFVAMAGNLVAGNKIASALDSYAAQHPTVDLTRIAITKDKLTPVSDGFDDFFRCIATPKGWAFQVGSVRWSGHQPRIEWTTYRRWTTAPESAQLQQERAEALKHSSFFRTCTLCHELKNVGHMDDSKMCQGCAQIKFPIVY